MGMAIVDRERKSGRESGEMRKTKEKGKKKKTRRDESSLT